MNPSFWIFLRGLAASDRHVRDRPCICAVRKDGDAHAFFFRRLSKDGEDSNLDRPFLLDKQAYLLNLVWSCLFHHTVCLLGWIPQFKVLPWTFTLLLILSNSQARPAYPINPAQLRNQANKAISMAGSKGRSFLFQQTRWDHQGGYGYSEPKSHQYTRTKHAHFSPAQLSGTHTLSLVWFREGG